MYTTYKFKTLLLEVTTDPPAPGMGACPSTNHIQSSVQVMGRPTISLPKVWRLLGIAQNAKDPQD